jgi:hypothetical protein
VELIIRRLSSHDRQRGRILGPNQANFAKARFHGVPPSVGAIFGMHDVVCEAGSDRSVIAWRKPVAGSCEPADHDRHRKAARSADPQDPSAFGQSTNRIRDVLERVGVQDEVEGAVTERHRQHVNLRIGRLHMSWKPPQHGSQRARAIEFQHRQPGGHLGVDPSAERPWITTNPSDRQSQGHTP